MAEEGQLVQPLETRILDLPPSCVEFCPAFPSYFVVGTYSLQAERTETDIPEDDGQLAQPRKPQNRNGSIVAFRLAGGGVTQVQTLAQPSALLDLHFNPHEGNRDVFAVVSSTATLAVFKLSPDEEEPLKHLNTMGLAAMSRDEISPSGGQEILFLSFAWHPARPDMMAITTSTGHVYLVHLPTFNGDWKLIPEPAITHTLETWCVAFPNITDPFGQSSWGGDTQTPSFRVYSGGDDSALRFRTCNWDDGSITGDLPTVDTRGHDAGVTAILPLFQQDAGYELVVTGSYDEQIRLFSVPPLGTPNKLAELGLGGGVWRLKLIDLDTGPRQDYTWRARILASCMHAGARIVELWGLEGGKYEFRVVGRFEKHKSMNYGSDFQPGWKDRMSIVSTSFYDRLLCLWEFRMA